MECGHGHSHCEDDTMEIDPGLAQCCVQDMEDSKKHALYMAKLRAADPIAKVERATKSVLTEAGSVVSTREWLEISHHESDDDSDYDDNELLRKLCLQRLSNLRRFADPKGLATFLSGSSPLKMVVFLDHEKNSEMGAAVCQSMEFWSSDKSELKWDYACIDMSCIPQGHPVRRLTNETEAPFVCAFDSKPVVVSRTTLKEISTSSKAIDNWLNSMLRLTNVEDSSDEEGETSNYCGRRGCDRKFEHKHITHSIPEKRFAS